MVNVAEERREKAEKFLEESRLQVPFSLFFVYSEYYR